MPVANYRSRVVFQAIQWDGTNEIEIAEWLKKDGIDLTVREAEPVHNNPNQITTPRQLVGIVSWGLMRVNVWDYVTRNGWRSFDVSNGNDFLKFNEVQEA